MEQPKVPRLSCGKIFRGRYDFGTTYLDEKFDPRDPRLPGTGFFVHTVGRCCPVVRLSTSSSHPADPMGSWDPSWQPGSLCGGVQEGKA